MLPLIAVTALVSMLCPINFYAFVPNHPSGLSSSDNNNNYSSIVKETEWSGLDMHRLVSTVDQNQNLLNTSSSSAQLLVQSAQQFQPSVSSLLSLTQLLNSYTN